MERAEETHRMGLWVHRSLISGLVVSGLLLIGGLALVLIAGHPRPEGPPPGFNDLLHAAVRGDAVALMDLGLLALMVSPVVRVAVLAVGWTCEREWRLLAVALLVLALLGLSMAMGVG
jgi:uncharacterized membrane protein